MPVTTCVFDAYGTLFDVSGAARAMAEQPGREAFAEHWPQIARDWRDKQLGYSWLRTVQGAHVDFWQLTCDGLDWALEAAGLHHDTALREDLLALYWELPAYAEVPPVLALLRAQGLATAILSNGSPDMLEGAVGSAGIEGLLDAVLSVEDTGAFTPARAVYDQVGTRFGTAPAEVLFVSANGWDAAAGAAYGFHTAWINRTGQPMERLPGRPAIVLDDLRPIPDLVGEL